MLTFIDLKLFTPVGFGEGGVEGNFSPPFQTWSYPPKADEWVAA